MAENAVGQVAGTRQARWTLRLIGPFHLARGDGQDCRIAGRRERALLAFLALAPSFRESRRNLATLLWGDETDALTLDNLRTCLWSLRRALGEEGSQLVQADREWVHLDATLLDIDERDLQAASAAGHDDAVEAMLRNRDGDLLEGQDLDTRMFQDWVRQARSRHAEAVAGALGRLMSARQAAGDAAGALAVGERILRVDPFDEATLRVVLEVYVATGRRHLALQEFRRFADRLQSELGVDPEAETAALVNRIAASPGRPDPSGHDAVDEPAWTEAEAALPPAEQAAVRAEAHPPRRRRRALRAVLIGGASLATAALAAIVVVGAMIWSMPELAPSPFGAWILSIKLHIARAPPALAALPFQTHGDAGAGEFADALVESVTSALARASEILVVSRGSVDELRGSTLTNREIARRLGVRYLLRGDINQRGDTVALTVWLIDTMQNGPDTAIGDFGGPVSNFFTLVQDIARKIVTTLQVQLTEGDQERITVYQGTRNHQAWLLASQGHKELRSLVPGSHVAARDHFREALDLDPNFAGAMTGYGWTYLVEPFLGLSRDPADQLRKADDWARRALALDDNRASTLALLGAVALFSGDIEKAGRIGDEAVALEYNDADSAALLALTFTYAGEPERALQLLGRAITLKPYPPRWYLWLEARAHRQAGRPHKAVQILEAANAGSDRSPVPMVELVLAYDAAGMHEDARQQAERVRTRITGFNAGLWARLPKYKDPGQRQREVDVLRAVGLGE